MKFKSNYLIIPLIVIAVAVIGSLFTTSGMPWYDTVLIRPEITPPKWAFPVAWNTIFVLTAISALLIWNKGGSDRKFLWIFTDKEKDRRFKWLIGLFIANAFLNVLWSFLFFTLHLILPAFIEMLFLEISLIAMIVLSWRVSKIAAILLLPYALWIVLATYLTWQILLLNPQI